MSLPGVVAMIIPNTGETKGVNHERAWRFGEWFGRKKLSVLRFVLCVSVVSVCLKDYHRGTENTEVSRRKSELRDDLAAPQPDIARFIPYNHSANGGDRLRQGFGRPTDAMPGFSKQLVKKPREKTIANSNELALAA